MEASKPECAKKEDREPNLKTRLRRIFGEDIGVVACCDEPVF